MRKYTAHRSGLFLMEIIIAILFFSVASASCLQLFVKSNDVSQDARTLDRAVLETSSAASIIQKADVMSQTFKSQYPNMDVFKDRMAIYYDSSYTPCQKDKAAYYMEIKTSAKNSRSISYNLAYISVKDKTPVYTLDVDTYQPYTP